LLLVQSKALEETPYKLSGAIAKLAGITFWSLAFSYLFDKPRFFTERKLATVLIIPSSWSSQLGGYLPTSVPRSTSLGLLSLSRSSLGLGSCVYISTALVLSCNIGRKSRNKEKSLEHVIRTFGDKSNLRVRSFSFLCPSQITFMQGSAWNSSRTT
jgi:hypothetical protein